MQLHRHIQSFLRIALAGAATLSAHAALITNGGFESGLAGWTTVDQIGSDGTFALQTGTASPVNGFPVPAPPEGSTAAMTDALGPGSHVLYQDIFIPLGFPNAVLSFSLFLGNGNGAPDYYTPNHLDFSLPDLNQQARVDLMLATADPFSVAGGDVLLNLYRTQPGQPLVSGYTMHTVDISSVIQSFQGQTVRLRIAGVDNVAPFNVGIDAIDITAVPEPSSMLLAIAGLAGCFARRFTGRKV